MFTCHDWRFGCTWTNGAWLLLASHALLRVTDNLPPLQIDHMDLLTKGVIVTSFLIYAWIEEPHKQSVIQETMDLLVQKVLVPHAGMDCNRHL